MDVLFECLFRHENGTCIGYKDEVVTQWMCYSNAFSGMRMVHVSVSYEDEMVVSQWMCNLIAFGHEHGTCIGYEDEVVVSQWMCYFNAFGHEIGRCIGYEDEVLLTQLVFPFDCLRA